MSTPHVHHTHAHPPLPSSAPSRTLNLEVSTAQCHTLPRSPSPLSPAAYPIHHTNFLPRDSLPFREDDSLPHNQQSIVNSPKPHPPPKPSHRESSQILTQPTSRAGGGQCVAGQSCGNASDGVSGVEREEVEVRAEKNMRSGIAPPATTLTTTLSGHSKGDESKSRSVAQPLHIHTHYMSCPCACACVYMHTCTRMCAISDTFIFTVYRVMVTVPVTSRNQSHARKKAPIPLPRKKLSSVDSPQSRPRPLPPPKPKLKKASSVDVALVSMQEVGSTVASNHGNREAASQEPYRRVQYMNLPPVEVGREEEVCEVDSHGHEEREICHVSSETGAVDTSLSHNYCNLSPLEGDVRTSQDSPYSHPSTEEFLARILQSEEGDGEEGEGLAEESAPADRSQQAERGEETALHCEVGQTQCSKKRDHPLLGRARSSDAVTHPALGLMWSGSRGLNITSNTDIHSNTRHAHMRTNGEPERSHMYYNLLLFEDSYWQHREGEENGGEKGEGRRDNGWEEGSGKRTGGGEHEREHFSGSMDVRQFPSEWLETKKGEERGEKPEDTGEEEKEREDEGESVHCQVKGHLLNSAGDDVHHTYLQIIPSSNTPSRSVLPSLPHHSPPHAHSKRPKPPKPPTKPVLLQHYKKDHVTTPMTAIGQEQMPHKPSPLASGGDSPCTPSSCSPLWMSRESASSLAIATDGQSSSSHEAFMWPSLWTGDGTLTQSMSERIPEEGKDEEEENWQEGEQDGDTPSKWWASTSDEYDYPYNSPEHLRPPMTRPVLVHSMSCSELMESVVSISDRPPAPLPSTGIPCGSPWPCSYPSPLPLSPS